MTRPSQKLLSYENEIVLCCTYGCPRTSTVFRSFVVLRLVWRWLKSHLELNSFLLILKNKSLVYNVWPGAHEPRVCTIRWIICALNVIVIIVNISVTFLAAVLFNIVVYVTNVTTVIITMAYVFSASGEALEKHVQHAFDCMCEEVDKEGKLSPSSMGYLVTYNILASMCFGREYV